MIVIGLAITGFGIFKKLADILSLPVAFLILKELICFINESFINRFKNKRAARTINVSKF